jgi:hypothetical protein
VTTCKARFPRRPLRSIAATAVIVFAGAGLAVPVGAAASVPVNPGHLQCTTTGRVLHVGHSCALHFEDRAKRTGIGAKPLKGHKVCFATALPNKVRGTEGRCSTTGHIGTASGTFLAKAAGIFTITASESYHAVDEGSVTVTVTVKV